MDLERAELKRPMVNYALMADGNPPDVALGRYRQLVAGAHALGLSAGPGGQPPAEQLQALCDEVQQRAWGQELELLAGRSPLSTGGGEERKSPLSSSRLASRLWLLALQGYDRLVQRLFDGTAQPVGGQTRLGLPGGGAAAADDDDDVPAGLRFQPGALEPWGQLLTRAALDTPAPELLRCSRTLASEARLCVKEALDLWAEVAAFARRSCRWDMPELLLPPDWQWTDLACAQACPIRGGC
eukprot:g75592.t1